MVEKITIIMLLALIVLYISYVIYGRIKKQKESQEMLRDGAISQRQLEKNRYDIIMSIQREVHAPVKAVCKMSKKLQNEEDLTYLRNNIGFIHASGVVLLEYMDDVFDYSLFQLERMEIENKEYSFLDMIDKVSDICLFVRETKDIDIIFDIDANIPNRLFGDAERLGRVISNAVSNAIKFTNTGGVSLSITYTRERGAINLLITVTDTGVGIPDEQLKGIQQAFLRLDKESLLERTELGLGLFMSYLYVSKMGGEYHIQSEEGVGTSVTVIVPQKIVDASPRVTDFHESVICYIDNNDLMNSPLENAYEMLFCHLTSQLGTSFVYCNSMTEFQHHLREEEFANVLISSKEYAAYTGYFNRIAERHHLVVASEFYERAQLHKNNVFVVGKPYDITTLVDAFRLKTERKQEEKTEKVVENPFTVEVPANGLVVGNLNTVLGCTYCGSETVYMSILKEHAQRGSKAWSTLQNLFDAEKWEEYGIEAHGIKSSMLTIGAEKLSEKAKQMEVASKNGDIAFIRNNHLDLMAEIQSVVSELRRYFSLPQETFDDDVAVDIENCIELKEAQMLDILLKAEEAAFSLDKSQMLQVAECLNNSVYHEKSLQSLYEEFVRKVNMEDYLSAFELLKKTTDSI